jgi:hypothetical protein
MHIVKLVLTKQVGLDISKKFKEQIFHLTFLNITFKLCYFIYNIYTLK